MKVRVDYALIDAQTGEDRKKITLESSWSSPGDCDTAPLISEALLRTSTKFADQLNINAHGKVIKINELGIYINLGSLDGISDKMIFEIPIKVDPITDPDSGKVIGWEKIQVIRLRPVQDLYIEHRELCIPC